MGLKFRVQETLATDKTNLNSQHQLRCLAKVASKLISEKATSPKIETMDLQLNSFQWKIFL